MFSLLVLAVVVVFGSACESACEGGKREVLLESLRELSQEEAELILSAETTLRGHFILSLAKLGEKIVGATSFYSAVEEILQGLRSRDLSPLKAFENGYSVDGHRPPAHQLATLIHSLQKCNSQELTFDDWHSFLQTIPNIETVIPPPPDIRITPQHLHKANSGDVPFVLFVLLAVHHNHLAPTATLLRHVLYNYRYKNYSPELDVIAQSLNIGQSLPRTDPAAVRPHEILSGLLESLPPRGDSVLAFQKTVLLSALSDNENIGQTRISPPWQLFGLIGSDEYPPDIVQAATELSAVVKNQQVDIRAAMLWGYSPLEQLLSVVTQLMTVRSTNSVSVKVHALYPHVKLRFLSYKQKFFRPRTSFDVALLLNSFLTTPSAAIIGEVHKIFLLPQYNWQDILKSFDYSKYSKPRSLFLDLLQELLRNPHQLPTCGLITFSIFLRKNSGVPNCPSHKISSDIINEIVHGQITPIFPDSLPTPQCPDGSPVELIDPDSIVEIMETNDCSAFIADLIKNAPIPVEKYPQYTRRSVYHAFLNNLQTANDTLAVRAIQQALNQTVLNDKADLSPKYLRLCPSKVTVMAAKPRAQSLRSCHHQSAGNPQEMLTAVNNTQFPLHTPREFLGETSHGGNLTKVFLIPLNSKLSYGKARALEELLDQLSTSTTDQTLLSHIDKVKSHIRTVQQPPAIVAACLPQTQSQQTPQGCKCQENESSVAVVNTTTLVPCTLCAGRVLDRIKFFIIAVDTSEKVTKRDVLLEILSYFEQSDEGAYNGVGVNKLKEILKSDETLEEADVLRVCMPNAVIEDMHQQTPETPLEINVHNSSTVLVTAALQHSLTPPEPATTNPLPVTKVNLSPSHSSPARLPFSSFSRPSTTDTATESTQPHLNYSTPTPFEKTALLPSVTSPPTTETCAINKTKTLDAPSNNSSALNANYFDTSNISSGITATATATAFPSTTALSALTARKNKLDTSTTSASSAFGEIHSSTTHAVPLSRQIDDSFSSTATPYPFLSTTPSALNLTTVPI